MLKPALLGSKLRRLIYCSRIPGLCLIVGLLGLPSAVAQSGFTLAMNPFPYPAAMDSNGTDSTTVTVEAVGGFSGQVGLTCQVTPQQSPPATTPTCIVSPSTVTTLPGAASVTVTGNSAPAALYTVAVTGAASGASQQSAQQDVSVLTVLPTFSLAVQRTVAPSSVPAGNAASGQISINPTNNYVSPAGGITLSCVSITPLVTIPPVCSFNPQGQDLMITGSGTFTSEITISTFGPVTTGAAVRPRGVSRPFSAIWLPLPMLALTGLGAALAKRNVRKAWGILALFIVSGGILLMPACGNTKTQTSTPNGVTPANTYTFTIQGVDANGQASSNTGSGSSGPTVTLTVTAPSSN